LIQLPPPAATLIAGDATVHIVLVAAKSMLN
jgi:hypothetical protein